MLSLGCPDSPVLVYPSLKSRKRIMTPLANVARSRLVRSPLPMMLTGSLLRTVAARSRAMRAGSLQ